MPTPSDRLSCAVHLILDHLQNGETVAYPLDHILLAYSSEIVALERLAAALDLASHVPPFEPSVYVQERCL